jgi:predicted nuclease of restriction endonuclease-like RecB superfamily
MPHAESGPEVVFEIVGFWTPEYLAQKREMLELFKGERILLAVPERSEHELAQKPLGLMRVVTFKTVDKLEPVPAVLKKILASARRRSRPGSLLTAAS